MSRDVFTVGSTMRISLLYRGEYSQWVERFMNYLEEQTDEEAMINSIKNGDQPLPRVTQVSISRTSSTEQPPLKDKSMWSDQEKKIQKIDRLARSLLIQGLSNDICSLIDSNKTAKDLRDALARHMLGSEYGEQDRKAVVLYEYETFKATAGEFLLDTYIRYLQVINDLKKCGLKNKTVVVTSDPLALIAEKTKVSKSKEKVVVSSDSEGSDADDFSELKKITALLAKAFIRRKIYTKPTNNNLRTSSTSQSANKKQEFVKTDDKKVKKKDDKKKRDMSKVKCYNCKKEEHFSKDCKKVKVKDYKYYKTKMLLAKKDKDEQVLLAEDQAWMESCSDSDQEINATWYSWLKLRKFFPIQRLAQRLLMTRFLRQMCGSEYVEQDMKAKILYEYETFKATEGEQLLDTYLRYLHMINDLNKYGYKKDNCDVNDALGYKKKVVVATSDPLALVAEKTKVSKRKEKVIVSSDSEGSGADDFSELKKIIVLLAKAFNRRKFYSKPTNNNLRTSSTSQPAN
nr:hypothetical protein [Tanacetum cinerariifolium]